MKEIQKNIIHWQRELLQPNQNDILFNLVEGKNAFAMAVKNENSGDIPFHSSTHRLYRQHKKHLKETNAPIFGVIQGKINFEWKRKSFQMPFLLAAASIHKNHFSEKYEVNITEDYYINPLLLKTLELDYLPLKIEEAVEKIEKLGLNVEFQQGNWVGNIHPHRFVLQKEFHDLLKVAKFSDPLLHIFGMEYKKQPLALSAQNLFPSNKKQTEAIALLEKDNLVLQGPPGTGKSQVISNVIGKILTKQKTALLVAEKQVALEVIYQQLKEKNLHFYAGKYHHQLQAKNFIRSIESTWKHLEKVEVDSSPKSEKLSLLRQQLDFVFSRLQQPDLIGGIGFSAFKNRFQPSPQKIYIDKKPTLPKWDEQKKVLEQLQTFSFPLHGAWTRLKLENFTLENCSEIIQKTRDKILKLDAFSKYNLLELRDLERKSALTSLFFYDEQPLPISVFKTRTKKHKQFLKLMDELTTCVEKEKLLKEEEKHWKKEFSLSELQEYLAVLSKTNRFNLHFWTTKKKLSKFTDLNLQEGQKALENLVELKTIQKEIVSLKAAFRALDLPDDFQALQHIQYTINRLKSVDKNELKAIFNWKEEKRIWVHQNAHFISKIVQQLNTYFEWEETKPLLLQIEEIQDLIPEIIAHFSWLQNIDAETKKILQQTTTLVEAEALIYHSHWKDFKGQFPHLANTSGETITAQLDEIMRVFEKESEGFAQQIEANIKQRFEGFHTLLQTPARKLSEQEKQLKKELRKGKSILVKAFAKKRVFPSVRELLESEAHHWIQLLHPIVLGSPYSVAKSIPMEMNFSLVVFDEASQIPLSHAAGAIQRAHRVLICGDQQQMAPQFYFQKQSQHQTDVLHHASYYWKNTMLTNHYRSEHPQLIAFSNRYFYQNKLQTIPSPFAKKPLEVIDANGKFIDRRNEKEAEIISQILIEKIKNNEFNFGLVAFSQTQLDSILEKIPTAYFSTLENQSGYFMQALENVQGDQCEHLIISLGYGKNEEGKFRKQFGPLNQVQGHRRLNVLMSRAISKITFVRSVSSEDFQISDNEGVEMLRKLMLFLEEDYRSQPQDLKGGKINKNEFVLSNITTHFEDSQALIDFYRAMKQRGWKVSINRDTV